MTMVRPIAESAARRWWPGGAAVEAFQEAADEDPQRALGQRLMQRGILWFVGGLVVTVFSYAAAVHSPYGGHYVIAYGAVIYGLAQYFRGRAAARGTDSKEQAEELLDAAAHLESVDRAKAVALYEEIVRNFPGTCAGKEAQRNLQTLAPHAE
jgi:hypothetical protein